MKLWFEFFFSKSSPLNLAGKIVLSPLMVICLPSFAIIGLLLKKECR